jgi:hypothetical protein
MRLVQQIRQEPARDIEVGDQERGNATTEVFSTARDENNRDGAALGSELALEF